MAFSGLTREQMLLAVMQKYLLDHPVDTASDVDNNKRALAKETIQAIVANAAVGAEEDGDLPLPEQSGAVGINWTEVAAHDAEGRFEDILAEVKAKYIEMLGVPTCGGARSDEYVKLILKIPGAATAGDDDDYDPETFTAPTDVVDDESKIMAVLGSTDDLAAKPGHAVGVISLCAYLVDRYGATGKGAQKVTAVAARLSAYNQAGGDDTHCTAAGMAAMQVTNAQLVRRTWYGEGALKTCLENAQALQTQKAAVVPG